MLARPGHPSKPLLVLTSCRPQRLEPTLSSYPAALVRIRADHMPSGGGMLRMCCRLSTEAVANGRGGL